MKKYFWHNGAHSYSKILICIVLGFIGALLPFHFLNTLQQVLFGWDIFCFCYLSFYWISFYKTPIIHIQKEAQKEDGSKMVIFTMVLVIIFISMLAVIMLLINKDVGNHSKYLQVGITIFSMLLSWSLLHTVYTVRYAHLYYANEKSDKGEGLEFPGDEQPDFLDFAYYSFVLGMTFQVSDVSITSKKIRKLTLWHSLISFGYNAVIIAITINILAGLGE